MNISVIISLGHCVAMKGCHLHCLLLCLLLLHLLLCLLLLHLLLCLLLLHLLFHIWFHHKSVHILVLCGNIS